TEAEWPDAKTASPGFCGAVVPTADPAGPVGGASSLRFPSAPARRQPGLNRSIRTSTSAQSAAVQRAEGGGPKGGSHRYLVPLSSITRSSRRGVSLRLRVELLRLGAVSPFTRPDSYRVQE